VSYTEDTIASLIRSAPRADAAGREAVAERAANVLRPTGALARLDEIAAWLAGWQRTEKPRVDAPAVIVFVGDHGVAERGVSAYPASVTAAMLRALREGVATATAMARTIGAEVRIVDMGVGSPTGDITVAPALDANEFAESFDLGRSAVASTPCDLLVLGEMGIGNTTPAAAIACALYGGPGEQWTGRGTGVDDETWKRKVAAVEAARSRLRESAGPIEILREVGGAELAATAGAIVEARVRSIPIVLDGFVVTASAAPLEALVQGALDHCIAGHRSPEPGHSLLLEKLAKEPLLDLGMRLGEGSGALAAVPIVRLAAAAVVEVSTFEEWGLS
jgi:nicotinate-nucleotide--dimethylbenzimidazole phosphoribosyltransferase